MVVCGGVWGRVCGRVCVVHAALCGLPVGLCVAVHR